MCVCVPPHLERGGERRRTLQRKGREAMEQVGVEAVEGGQEGRFGVVQAVAMRSRGLRVRVQEEQVRREGSLRPAWFYTSSVCWFVCVGLLFMCDLVCYRVVETLIDERSGVSLGVE